MKGNIYIFFILLLGVSNSNLSAQVTEDFEGGFPAGWFVAASGGPGTGNFVIGNPRGTNWQPENDHTAGGTIAVYSATNPGGADGTDDIDTRLVQIQTTTYPIAQLSRMSVWYFFGQRDTGDDPGDLFILDYSLDGGTTFQELVFIGDVQSQPIWREAVLDVIAGSNFVLRMRAQDGNTAGDIIETGIDDFTITPYDNSVTLTNPTVNESAGTVTFTATHNGPNIGAFSVDYATANNTAFANGDYTTQSATLNFSGASNQSINITIPITNDAYGEVDETFFVNLSNPSNTAIGLGFGTGTIIDDGDPAVPVNVPLTLFDEFNGYFDYALTGDSFRDDPSDDCSIDTTKPGVLLTTPVPTGATIAKAYLLWAHSEGNPDDTVTFEGQIVTADIVNQTSFGAASMFGMISDVTSIINTIPVADLTTNLFELSDLTIDNGDPFCSSTVVVGGWSLMIFYTEPTLPAVSINFYRGFDGQRLNSNDYTLDGFFAIGSIGSKTTVLSWEGDVGLADSESLTISNGLGTAVNVELVGDGNNDGTIIDNPFNSTVFDNTILPNVNRTTLGLDLDTYDISAYIATGESSVTTTVNVGSDFVALNAVLLKVPSNLMTGKVFEDVNYPGGNGRDMATSLATPVEGATVELYDNSGVFIDDTTTDVNGEYFLGGMANGTYSIRVVNSTVESNRGGTPCAACFPIQTFKRNYAASTFSDVTTEIGGANPGGADVAAGTLTGAQSISSITILNEGVVGIDFGFNFNTIVNTNVNGQGSLEQFIINSNTLNEVGLDIEAHPNDATLNPAAGEDTSIFMIPSSSDPLGRPADANIVSGYFDIFIPNSTNLTNITGDNTHIDGRTQTAYSGDTNAGTTGAGGTNVGTSATALPIYNLPEIQVHRNAGDLLDIQADNIVIRNIDVYTNNNAGIRMLSGSSLITACLIGVNANGVFTQNIDFGIEVTGGTITIDSNYIADTTDGGIYINGGTSSTIQNNHITNNGDNFCNDNISILNGSGVIIQNNLIENASAFGIDDGIGDIVISENTITTSGRDVTACTDSAGISISGDDTTISNNIIHTNGGAGIIVTGGTTSGNTISQNSIYNNGTLADALGIDINNDGVTINDTNDADAGPNGSLNFPILESASISGTTLKIVGWARPGATIEIFLTDINEGTATAGDNIVGGPATVDYGEGQVYIGSGIEGGGSDNDATTSSLYTVVDGNTDSTNRFNFSIPLSATIPVGSLITTTATQSGSTSEFGNGFPVGAATVITNRRITIRASPN